ncbi:hypothetical protein RRF57_008900 [Xylaria bambusicola]|uniref:Uncharacterized protein n=1 Tax=Xylaria bambusicola TaxID=326684 RepID=A0AAN7ZBL4_9PEZI
MTADNAVFFESSVCPEPGVFIFIGFTILSGFTIFTHLLVSYAPTPASNCPNPDRRPEKIIKSIFYIAISAIMLVDACWLTHIYSWGITGLLAVQTQGIIEWSFIRLWVAVTITCLLPLIVLWLWTLWSLGYYFFELWAYQHHSSDVSTQVLKREIRP